MNRCHFCGGELVEQLTTFLYENNSQVSIVRNVPAFVCKQCGEKEYTPETTHRILTFLKHPTRPADIMHVLTYDLAQVA